MDSHRWLIDHLGRAATTPAIRDALRAAAAAIEAREQPVRTDPDEALEAWRGLLTGCWTVLDQFEAEGKRFVVVQPNRRRLPRSVRLSARERQVAREAALGRSNKVIAYGLGLSVSTVATLLRRACRKLGVVSRLALTQQLWP